MTLSRLFNKFSHRTKAMPVYPVPNEREGWQLISLYTIDQLKEMKTPAMPRGKKYFAVKESTYDSRDLTHKTEFEICVYLTDEKGTRGERLYAYWYRLIEYTETPRERFVA